MASVGQLALVPFKRTVYVAKLPFVLVWMGLVYICALLYSIAAKIVSVPANYVKRAARRIQLTWNWTKSSTRAALPWRSNADTQGACEQELEEFDSTDLRHGLKRALRNRHGKRSHRKAIIASLIRILLDPVSPAESEEETEIVEDDEDEKVYKLIRDLMQISRSRPHSSQTHRSSSAPGLDIETLRQHARDKVKLQDLITELDQYVKDMDAGSKGHGREDLSGEGSGTPQGLGDEDQEMLTPDPTVGSNSDTDMYMDTWEGEAGLEASGGESVEEYGEDFDDAHSTLSIPHARGLSPVAEVSPEAVSVGSTESLEQRNCVDLESELNTALSQLNTLTDELTEVEVSVLGSKQTKVTETVTITSVAEAKQEDESRKNSTETSETSFEDAAEDFPSISKTSPILGLEAGHAKRNLATARKARPPSLPKGSQEQLPSDGVGDKGGPICSLSREDSEEFEERHSSSSEEEDYGDDEIKRRRVTGKLPPGAVQVFPPPSLSDQFKLLTPRDAAHLTPSHQSQATADLYSTVNKTPRTRSEGDGVGEEATPPESGRYRSQSDSHSNARSAEKTLFMHDLTPPWKQMRSHNSSSNSSSDLPNATPSTEQSPHTVTQTTAPPLTHRSYTPPTQSHLLEDSVPCPAMEVRRSESPGVYDKLPRVLPPPPIPSKAGEEGVYDIIPGHKRHRYLHEKMAACDKSKEQARSTPPVSWTPQLPPRNSTLTRTCSAELMGNVVKDQDSRALTRHGTERLSSSSLAHVSRERSASFSTSKRVRNSSTEREREKRIRRDCPSSDQHSRSSDCSPGERRRSSSSEKHRSSPGEKHRSSPGEKHRSSSGEKHSSSSEKHRSSSEKHHSPDKKSLPSSSKSDGSGSVVWRILSTTKSSTKSSSTTKEPARKTDKEKKEERRGKDKEKKHSSSRRESSDSTARTQSSVSQRGESMPRNESSSSLRSGVSMLSTDSSGRESLV